jgi:hypothetical protein
VAAAVVLTVAAPSFTTERSSASPKRRSFRAGPGSSKSNRVEGQEEALPPPPSSQVSQIPPSWDAGSQPRPRLPRKSPRSPPPGTCPQNRHLIFAWPASRSPLISQRIPGPAASQPRSNRTSRGNPRLSITTTKILSAQLNWSHSLVPAGAIRLRVAVVTHHSCQLHGARTSCSVHSGRGGSEVNSPVTMASGRIDGGTPCCADTCCDDAL